MNGYDGENQQSLEQFAYRTGQQLAAAVGTARKKQVIVELLLQPGLFYQKDLMLAVTKFIQDFSPLPGDPKCFLLSLVLPFQLGPLSQERRPILRPGLLPDGLTEDQRSRQAPAQFFFQPSPGSDFFLIQALQSSVHSGNFLVQSSQPALLCGLLIKAQV